MARLNPLFSVDPNINTFLNSPTSLNLATAVTDETGTGNLLFSYSPLITAANASSVGAIIRGASGQSADLTQWQDSSGTRQGYVSSGGNGIIFPGVYANYELYVQSGGASVLPLRVRGAASQSANLQEWQNSAGTTLIFMGSGGQLRAGTSIAGTGWAINNQVYGASVIPLVVRGATSQTANLQEWQDSAGTVHSGINASGFFFVGGASSPGGQIGIQTEAATNRGMVIKGSASQSANLQEWQNSAGTVLTHIDSVGRLNSTTAINVGGFTPGTAFVGIQTAPTVVGPILS